MALRLIIEDQWRRVTDLECYTMIRDRLIPEIKRAFSGWEMEINPVDNPIIRFPAARKDVGDVLKRKPRRPPNLATRGSDWAPGTVPPKESKRC